MNAVSIKNLRKEYKDFALDDISLEIPTGSIMGLIGENGAGKSTLIRLILGNIKPTGGEITLLGENERKEFCRLRQNIGVVPDEVAFPENFKLKHIEKNMSLIFENWDSKIFNRYVEQFEIPTNKKFKDFSFGTKKKLGIAVALSHNAKLLIFDEATSGLDPIARDELVDILYDFTRNEEHTVLFSSHIVSDLEKLCDYIAALHKGKLIFCEEKDVLLDKYRMVNCTREQLSEIPSGSVIGERVSPYGVQAVVLADDLPNGAEGLRPSVEDLFVFMAKEDKTYESSAV